VFSIPSQKIEFYPTLKFFRKGESTPSQYDREFTVDNLVHFVREHTSFKWVSLGNVKVEVEDGVTIVTEANFNKVVVEGE
jgi:hypothetical protein